MFSVWKRKSDSRNLKPPPPDPKIIMPNGQLCEEIADKLRLYELKRQGFIDALQPQVAETEFARQSGLHRVVYCPSA